jgi:uncharacterized membrane protein
MLSNGEVRRLRQDLDEVINRTASISRRLAELEARDKQRVLPVEPPRIPKSPELAAPPPVEAAHVSRQETAVKPPPLPAPPHKTPSGEPVAAPDVWTMEALAAGPIGRYVRERIEDLRSRTRELGWEVILGTYWLPRVAMVCIAIAVVFFLTLAIERWGVQWMPHLRVGIGYAVCAGLLLLAWRSEAKYGGFARVLYGGGFAIMYFVTFATHYVRFARVFESPAPTLVLLTAVVAAWAIAAQVRQSRVIAVLVTTLGHLTVLLSTLTLNNPGPVSMTGLVVLSAGSAFFLLRNRWYYVASLGLVGSYVNDFVALAHGRAGDPYTDFTASMSVLGLFFLVFALAELFSPEELRRKTVPVWFRNAFVTVNTAAFFALGTVLMYQFDFTREHQDLFRFAFAAVLMLIGLGYLQLRAADPLFNVYFVKSVALATLALATRYGGSSLSAWLAVETVVLLVAARRSGLVVTRVLALAIAAIAFVQSLSVSLQVHVAYDAEDYAARLLQAMLGVASFLAASQLYQRTDWLRRSPRTAPLDKGVLALCWQSDLIAERPAGLDSLTKPLQGLLFPYLYALTGAVVFLGHTRALLAEGHRFPVIAGFACAMVAAAHLLNSKPFGFVSVGLAVAAALPVGAYEILHETVFSPYPVVAGLAAMTLVALASEANRLGMQRGLEFHQHVVSPYILYGTVALLTGLVFSSQLSDLNATLALAGAAVVTGALVLVLHPTALAGISIAFLVWASAAYVSHVFGIAIDNQWRFTAWALVALSVAADRFFAYFRQRTRIAPFASAVSMINAMVVLWRYLQADLRPEWMAAAVAAACFAFCAYDGLMRSPAALGAGVAAALAASVRLVVLSFHVHTLDNGILAGFVLLALFWLGIERTLAWFKEAADACVVRLSAVLDVELPTRDYFVVPIALATSLLLVMAYRIPHLVNANPAYITIGWFGITAGCFVLSLGFRQRDYRYAGLAVIVLSLGRLFLIDMKEQDPLLRVAAFAVVGAGLLAISIGYYKWMARVRAEERNTIKKGPLSIPNDAE